MRLFHPRISRSGLPRPSPFLTFTCGLFPIAAFSQLTTSVIPTSALLAARPSSIGNAKAEASTPSSTAPSSSSASASASSTNSSAPSSTSSSSKHDDDGLLNYYFLLLAILVFFLIAGWWAFNRRKKNKSARARNNGQNALAMDLEGWTSNSRWMHGGWRGMVGVGERREEREEGLDERGEAPPPYQPEEARNAHSRAPSNADDEQRPEPHRQYSRTGGEGSAESTIVMPDRALSRDDLGLRSPGYKPPEYHEAL
ncbi:MAG: hypothetical protein M1819_007317 [Sarea resinae]|nr:MAG: hypothetical protein M1819_007317 [Sarea resinae]